MMERYKEKKKKDRKLDVLLNQTEFCLPCSLVYGHKPSLRSKRIVEETEPGDQLSWNLSSICTECNFKLKIIMPSVE